MIAFSGGLIKNHFVCKVKIKIKVMKNKLKVYIHKKMEIFMMALGRSVLIKKMFNNGLSKAKEK